MKSENALWLPQNAGNFITELHDLISLFAHSKSWHVCTLVLKVSIYTTWCTRQVSGAQKMPICVKYIEKSYQLIFPLFPICENI